MGNNNRYQISRRGLLAGAGGAALAAGIGNAHAAVSNVSGMPQEGPDTPKLTMYISADPKPRLRRRSLGSSGNHKVIGCRRHRGRCGR